MKQCPHCQKTYADDSLKFCLQDGTPLAEIFQQNSLPNDEPETLVAPKRVEPIRFDLPSSYESDQADQSNWQPSQPVIIEKRESKKSNTAMVVVASVLGTLLLVGLGGLGTWLYFRNQTPTRVAVNVNSAPVNRPFNANAANNQNANLATPSPTATPTAQPTLKPDVAKAVTSDVKAVVDEWKDSTENLDLDTHIGQYADTVDYYNGGKVNVSRVRDDRAKAFATYDTLNINLDNVKVTPDPSGEKATVVLDKEWDFEGVDKISSGKVQQQLTFSKINGRWRITGEKDLKVYYKN